MTTLVSKAAVIAVVVLATIGWMGLATSSVVGSAKSVPIGNPFAGPSAPSASVAAPEVAVAAHPATSPNLATAMAHAALSASKAAGLKPNVVFVPRPSASPLQEALARQSGVVSPLYNSLPAPLGLAYYGLNTTGGGAIQGTVFNTTGVQASVDENGTGIRASDLFQSSPDSYGVQLNAVLTNVTLFGTPGYQFWTQDVVEYYPAAQFMILITNVWNFSGLPISGNALYSHGPYGTDAYGSLGFYYAEKFLFTPITYPFNLTLTLNSSVSAGRDNISFDVRLTGTGASNAGESFSAPYDWAVFNSTPPSSPALTQPSSFTADGLHYNPIGLTNDFELDVCGPGGGSQADLTSAYATLGLSTWNGTGWAAVPAAYSYGGETGETATGANVAWSNGAGGPAGLADYGTMTTGPAELTGLWGTGAPQGSTPVTLAVSPGNAFNFLQYNGTVTFNSPHFLHLAPAYAPTVSTTTFYLMPGTYYLTTELSQFDPVSQSVVVSGPGMTVTVTLTSDPARGVYTPLWAFNNAEVAALATSGSGTPASPYMIANHQTAPIGDLFGLYNDFGFPVFPGVWFMGTTVPTELFKPPSLTTTTNTSSAGLYLPTSNDGQFWFWNVSHVSLVNATNISGWFTLGSFYPTAFDTFNVIFYESSNNLIAGNTFDTESQALLLFEGGGVLAPPLNIGTANNTVWGNRFLEVNDPACAIPSICASRPLLYPGLGIGIEIAEGPDLIYNNIVVTPTTAWELPINLYSGNPEFFPVAWNITPQPAANTHFAAGFPSIPLSGSILGTSQQGGNFWWDYGNAFNPFNGADNPFGALPYQENSTTYIAQLYPPSFYSATWIYPGGDFAPLFGFALHTVVFHEVGLPLGTQWGLQVTNRTGSQYYENFVTTQSLYVASLPTGLYTYFPVPVSNFIAPTHGYFAVGRASALVTVPYHPAPGFAVLTFREHGLPLGTNWSVTIAGTTLATDPYGGSAYSTGAVIQFAVLKGPYSYTVPGVPGWNPSSPSGLITVLGPVTLFVHFTPYKYAVTFTESGLRTGAFWVVKVTGPALGSGTQLRAVGSHTTMVSFSLPNGSYIVQVVAPRGYSCSTASPVVVNGAPVAAHVSCTGPPPLTPFSGPTLGPVLARSPTAMTSGSASTSVI